MFWWWIFMGKRRGNIEYEISICCSCRVKCLSLIHIFAAGLFLGIPTAIASLFKNTGISSVALNLIEAIIRIAILIAYMFLISKLDDIYRVFQYHGAEHKTIFCYEADEKLTVENVRTVSYTHLDVYKRQI